LEEAFPENAIVVRPHPGENHELYRKIADQCRRVHVTNEGNIVRWLIATQPVIHNGSKIGVEVYVTGTPAISYRATINETYGHGFYCLPNRMSLQCFTFKELRDMLRKILKDEMGVTDGDECQRLFDFHLAGKTGPLDCERIAEVLEGIRVNIPVEKSVSKQTQRWLVIRALHLAKWIKSSLPGSHNRPEYQRHRFSGISLEALCAKLLQFQQLLGNNKKLKVEQMSDVIFQINP
jgi:hypothetical protein